jgi:hypothetical protein
LVPHKRVEFVLLQFTPKILLVSMECEVFICLRQAFRFFEALPNIKAIHTIHTYIYTYKWVGKHVLQLQWKKAEQVFVV